MGAIQKINQSAHEEIQARGIMSPGDDYTILGIEIGERII